MDEKRTYQPLDDLATNEVLERLDRMQVDEL